MKKLLTMVLSLVLLLSFSACEIQNSKEDDPNKESKESTKLSEEEKKENCKEELVKIKVEGGELAGIICTPIKNTNNTLPIVLIVPGSGAVPKNGIANEYAQLASELAVRGIASLRYDKRGSYDSNGIQVDESKIRVNDYVRDIQKLIAELDKDERFSDVFLLGHSQGALYGAIAIQESPVKGFISVAGAGRTIDLILKEQIKNNELNPPEVINETNSVLNELKKGNTVEEVSEVIKPLFRRSIQDYFIDWISYDPVKEYKKIKDIPIIIIQGKNDIQIAEKDAKLLASALDDNEAILIDKMSHILKNAATKEDRKEHIKIYSDVKAPLNEEFISSITAFINENKSRKE